jgi:DNA-binding Xre family transcriptional regulator
MTLKELSNINKITRKLITDYITNNNISENKFAEDSGISQSQLWIYLHSGNAKKGIHTTTLEKIGKYLNDQNKL